MTTPLHIIGGGLAGCEAAWQCAERGIPVVIHEMRPTKKTEAHQSDKLAELVCSNSLRSDDSDYNAVGLLHEEMRRCNSLILKMADQHKVPAGGALAVDRDNFAAAVTAAISAHPLITITNEEITELPTAEKKWDPRLRGDDNCGLMSEKRPSCQRRLASHLVSETAEQNKTIRDPRLRGHDTEVVGPKLINNSSLPRKRESRLVSKSDDENHGIDSWNNVIIATGPLTSEPLAQSIRAVTGEDSLHFFDAIAPIVERESIDMSKAWMQSRYDKGDAAAYINCAMNREQYEAFIGALLAAEKTEFKEWEKNTSYFEGCLPIEVMASRGMETLRYGPMKPVGLTNPHDPKVKSYAIIQLRQDNTLGTLWNIVGFQTKMKYAAQERVFRMIPGLENAVFARLGGIHRNTFINSPRLLDHELRLKSHPHIRFAGQVMGVEGYVESASMGLLAGLFAAAEAKGATLPPPPRTTALGALLAHVTGDAEADTFQPMNVTFSLFPPITNVKSGRDRKLAYTQRAKEDLVGWLTIIDR